MLLKSTVKYIQSLQYKKVRDLSGCFIAEGPKVVNELLDANIFECNQLFGTEKWVGQFAEKYSVLLKDNFQLVDEKDLERLSLQPTPNMVLAVFKKRILPQKPVVNGLTIMLDDIQDPGNLGTIIRSADWFGVKSIICSPQTADCYNPKVVQSTMASLARVEVYYLDLVETIAQLRKIPVIATSFDGNHPSALSKLQDVILIIGNESKGISPEVLNCCNEKITIPRFGEAESLNAAIAASILMYAHKLQ